MDESRERQELVDREHLKVLSVAYYILGGSKALFAFIPAIYIVIGAVLSVALAGVRTKPGEPSPAIVGALLMLGGIVAMLLIATFALLQILAAHYIRRRRHRIFCFVVAALGCLSFPWGIAVGVGTFIVLSRPTVAALFDAGPNFSPENGCADG